MAGTYDRVADESHLANVAQRNLELWQAYSQSPKIGDYSQIKDIFESVLARIARNYGGDFSMHGRNVRFLEPDQLHRQFPKAGKSAEACCEIYHDGAWLIGVKKLKRPHSLVCLSHEYGHTLYSHLDDPILEELKALTFEELFLTESMGLFNGDMRKESLAVRQMRNPEGLKVPRIDPLFVMRFPPESPHYTAERIMQTAFTNLYYMNGNHDTNRAVQLLNTLCFGVNCGSFRQEELSMSGSMSLEDVLKFRA